MAEKSDIYLAQAKKYEEIGNFAEAFSAYLKWVEAEQTVESYIEVGKFCEMHAEFRKAASMYSAALELDPLSREAQIRLKAVQSEILATPQFSLSEMRSLLAEGLVEKAIDTFTQAVSTGAVDIAAVPEIIRFLWRQSTISLLIERLKEESERGEVQDERLFAFVELLARSYNGLVGEELEDFIGIAMGSGVSEVDVRYAIGVALASMGRFGLAINQLERAFALSGGRRDMLQSLAAAVFADGKSEEALLHFQRIASEFLESIETKFKVSSLDKSITSVPTHLRPFFEEGLRYYAEGNYKEASLAFHAGLSEQTPPISILLNLGICYIKQSQYDLAIRFLSRARSLSRRNTAIIWNLAVALYKQGLFADSSRVLGEYLNISPNDRRALLCAAHLEHRLGRRDRAVQLFEHVLALPNPPPEVRIVSGTLLHLLRKPEEAQKHFRALVDELFGEQESEESIPEAELGPPKKPYEKSSAIPVNLNKPYYTGSELYEIFAILSDTQEYDRAIEFFQRYASEHPSYVTPMLLLAKVYEQKGNIRKAYECLLQAANRNPDKLRANALVNVATFCLQHGLRNEARSALRLALAQDPQHQRAIDLLHSLEVKEAGPFERHYTTNELHAKFQGFIEEGALEEGIAFFRNYAEQSPVYVTPVLLAARLLEQLGRVEEAAAMYKEAIERTPDISKRADIFVELGKIYLEYQRYEEAKEAFVEALSHRPGHAEAHRQLQLLRSLNPPLLYAYWEECRQTGQYEHALRYFQNLVKDAPENHHLWLLIGYAYQNLGEMEQAYEAMAKAAELSQSSKIYEKLGWFCLQNRMYQRSKQAYQEALRINPHSFYARQGLSKISKAMVKGIPVRTKEGKPTMAHLNAVWDQFRADGLYDQAIEYFRKLIAESPDFAPTYEFLAKAYEARGEKQQGYQALLQMCEVETSDDNYIRLGAYCERNGLAEQAIHAYEKVLEINPFNALAKKRLIVLAPKKYPGVEYITGNEFKEDLARDLCRKPWDKEAGKKLVEVFIKDKASVEAEKTFRLLQNIHPDKPEFRQYLAQVFQGLGEYEKALAEAQAALAQKEIPEARAIVEQITEQIGVTLIGEHNLSKIAPKVAADWRAFRLDTTVQQELEKGKPKQVATEYYKKASALEDPKEKARLYLISAKAREAIEQVDMVLRCLFQYAKAMSEFYKFEGQIDAARLYLIEAIRITTISAKGEIRSGLLSQCITDYFELASLMKSLEEIVEAQGDIQVLTEVGRQFLGGKALKIALELLGEIVDAMAKYMTVETHSDKELYLAQALSKLADLRAIIGVKLKAQQRYYAFKLCSNWKNNLQAVRKLITSGAEVQLVVPKRKVAPKGEIFPLFVDIKNEGKAPAENIILRLMPSSDYRAEDYEQTVNILPAGKSIQREFRLIPSFTGSRDFDVRFSIEYSDLYTGHKRREFSTVISVRPETEPFEPIRNPYIAGPAIPPESSDIFFGRQDVLRIIRETLTGDKRDNILMIHGLRRVGKTSILNNLLATMQPPYIPVLLDMQGFSGDDYRTGELLFGIAEIICREVAHRDIDAPSLFEDEFLSKPTYTFRRFIDKLAENLGDNRLLLMFDEFEVMIRKVANGIVDPNILDFMRNLMQHQPKLSFLFSGADQLLEMVANYASVMFNLAIPVKISFLDLQSARRLIEEPAQRVGVEYHPIAVERILANTAGQPYFIQLICRHLIQRLNMEERRFITVVDVESVINELVTSIAKTQHFDHLWDVQKVPLVDRLLMSCIAELSEHEMDWVRQERILETLRENGREINEAQFVSSVVRLQERDIIEEKKTPGGGLEYRIKVNLFRQWFRHHKPLSKTLMEA